jgi:RND family efflux transporter MFP subunit
VDLSTVWVEAEVYEYELPWIKPGLNALVTLTYLPGQTFHGRVEYIYPYLKGATRTARVRIKIPNPQLKLKPEMYAQAEIVAPLGKPVVAVPSEAVLNTGEKQYVFLSLGKGRFEPREVKLGVDNGEGWLEVTSGLKRGQEVVTSAQFLLDSESRFREAIANMLKPAGEASLGAPAPASTGAPAPKAPASGMEPMHQKH